MHQMLFGERADLIVIGEHPLKASAALDGVAVAVSRTPPLRRATGSKGREGCWFFSRPTRVLWVFAKTQVVLFRTHILFAKPGRSEVVCRIFGISRLILELAEC